MTRRTWPSTRLKNVIESVQTGTWGKEPHGDGTDVICVRVADFNRSNYGIKRAETVRWVPDKDRLPRLLRSGDILLEKSGGTDANPVGFTAMFDGEYEAVSSNFISRIRLSNNQNPRFWLYALGASYATRRTEQCVRRTTGIQNLDQGAFFNELFAVPPLDEQLAIADYLDRETSQIDTLIAEQERLIVLLRERRQAIASNLLHRTPDWTDNRIKNIAETTLGKMLDAGREVREGDKLKPYVRAADVLADGTVNLNDLNQMPFTSEEASRLDLCADDILLIEGGATVGRPGMLATDAPGVSFQKTVNRVRVFGAEPRFVYWQLKHLYDTGYYDTYYGSVSFAHLTAEKLREVRIPLPPRDVQVRIAAALDQRSARIDELITETERFIELSRERRTALITAAVTGQIDVREGAA